VVDQTINLACSQGNTLVDVVNLIALALGKNPNARFEPSRAGEVTCHVTDISKARTLLGHEPQAPLTSGLPWANEWGQAFRQRGA